MLKLIKWTNACLDLSSYKWIIVCHFIADENLEWSYVTKDITIDQFDEGVVNITVNSCLGLSNEELSMEGQAQNKALHISMKCLESILSRVLMNNGSSLNVMPKSTLKAQSCLASL